MIMQSQQNKQTQIRLSYALLCDYIFLIWNSDCLEGFLKHTRVFLKLNKERKKAYSVTCKSKKHKSSQSIKQRQLPTFSKTKAQYTPISERAYLLLDFNSFFFKLWVQGRSAKHKPMVQFDNNNHLVATILPSLAPSPLHPGMPPCLLLNALSPESPFSPWPAQPCQAKKSCKRKQHPGLHWHGGSAPTAQLWLQSICRAHHSTLPSCSKLLHPEPHREILPTPGTTHNTHYQHLPSKSQAFISA